MVSLAETWEEHLCGSGCSHTKAVNSVEFSKINETGLNYGNVFLFHPINGFKHNLDMGLLVCAFYNC